MKFLSTRVESDLWDRLDEIARENDRSLSAEVRRALREYVDGYDGSVAAA